MTLEILKVIIMACQVGSMGMGGNYDIRSALLEDHQTMLQRSMDMQRSCQKRLITCAMKKTGFIRTVIQPDDLAECLSVQP